MLIFHSLSYIAVLHTECLKSTATRLRFNEVVDCTAFPLNKLFFITFGSYSGAISTYPEVSSDVPYWLDSREVLPPWAVW